MITFLFLNAVLLRVTHGVAPICQNEVISFKQMPPQRLDHCQSYNFPISGIGTKLCGYNSDRGIYGMPYSVNLCGTSNESQPDQNGVGLNCDQTRHIGSDNVGFIQIDITELKKLFGLADVNFMMGRCGKYNLYGSLKPGVPLNETDLLFSSDLEMAWQSVPLSSNYKYISIASATSTNENNILLMGFNISCFISHSKTEAPTKYFTASPITFRPTSAMTHRVTVAPSVTTSMSPTLSSQQKIHEKFIKCNSYIWKHDPTMMSAYFTSQQLIENITISTFTQSDVSESFVQAVQCAMINSRTVGDLLISITGISQATVSPTALRNFHMQGSSGTSAAVDVQYSVMFQFPIPQNISRTNSRMKVYYDLLTKQLTSSVSSSEFLYLFREYMVENGVDLEASHLETVSATQPPLYSSPILATVAPTATPVSSMTDSVSTTQPSLVNAVVTAVSVVIGVLFLCVLYAMYSIYRQYQLYQERDAQKLQLSLHSFHSQDRSMEESFRTMGSVSSSTRSNDHSADSAVGSDSSSESSPHRVNNRDSSVSFPPSN